MGKGYSGVEAEGVLGVEGISRAMAEECEELKSMTWT